MKAKFIFFVLLFFVKASFAQTLFSISQKTVGNVDYLSKINPLTGSVTVISASGLAKYVSSGISSIDPINKRFFFMSSGDTLYNVNLLTGNLIAKNKLSLNTTTITPIIEFNCQDTTLYAISQTTINNMDYLSKINPMTGSVTIVSASGLAKYVYSGISSIDPINKRLFFMSSADTLYNVNLLTGNLVAKNKLSLNTSTTTPIIEFNCQDGILYSISQATVNSIDYLSKINPMTGSVTIISASGLAKYVYSGVSSLDPINNRFFFMSLADTLYNVNLLTGNMIAKNKLSLNTSTFTPLIEFEKQTCALATNTSFQNKTSELMLFPNPNNGTFNLHTGEAIENGKLILINVFGQKVYEQKIKQGQNNIITQGLSSGLYYYIILQDKEPINNGKLIIE